MKILNNENNEINKLDLGMVEAGKTKDYTYILENEEKGDAIDIKINVAHEEVEVLEYPETLKALSKGNIKLRWSPSITLKRGLQTLIKISGKTIYT